MKISLKKALVLIISIALTSATENDSTSIFSTVFRTTGLCNVYMMGWTSLCTDGDDTRIDNNVPVRPGCIEMSSSSYIDARQNDSTQCATTDDCDIGLCRLAVGINSKWLFCDEGENYDSIGWLPVCENEEEVKKSLVDDSSGFCFPGTARVTVLDKGDIPMSQLQLGDSVLVDTKGNYESVYTFGHYQPTSPTKAPFMKVKTDEGSELTLSLNHMVETSLGTIPAAQLKKGDYILNSLGKIEVVDSTKKIQLRQGMYAPFTASGYLIVDNILVSNYVAIPNESFLRIAGTYTIASHQWISHAFNAPHRMYCRYSSSACTTEKYNTEGISEFAEKPLALSKWIFKQNAVVMGACSILIVLLCGIFTFAEQCPVILFLLLEAIVVLHLSRFLATRIIIGNNKKKKNDS